MLNLILYTLNTYTVLFLSRTWHQILALNSPTYTYEVKTKGYSKKTVFPFAVWFFDRSSQHITL